MMRQPTDEEVKLYEALRKTTDREKIKKLNKRLREIAKEERAKLKDWPFVH